MNGIAIPDAKVMIYYLRTKYYVIKLCFKTNEYIATASGAVSGPYPTKSLGAGLLKPCSYFISLAFSQSAGNWRFRSIPFNI